jgi:hypothetical protein
MGIPEQVLLRMAGWAQQKAKTSKEEWGNPIGSAPYGDDPGDQQAIQDGIQWAKDHKNEWQVTPPLLEDDQFWRDIEDNAKDFSQSIADRVNELWERAKNGLCRPATPWP